MLILSLKIKLHAPWVHSLKEKRMVVKSLLSKMRNKFNVAVAEVGEHVPCPLEAGILISGLLLVADHAIYTGAS